MRLLLVPLIIWMVVNIGVDCRIFLCLSKQFGKRNWVTLLYAILSFLLLALIIVAVSLPSKSGDESTLRVINWLLFIYLTFYIPKYLFLLFDVISKIVSIICKRRFRLIRFIGAVLGILLFGALWWGCLINRYRIDIKKQIIEITNLPPSFEGYRIVQFSDFHVGTYYNDTTFVKKVVDTINALKPDAIVFTGDIVNRHTSEINPFVNTLSGLEAPDVLAILGNHDYGDYYKWNSPKEKEENMEMLYDAFHRMGWHLLRNETQWIVRDNDSIAFIGVENIGDPPFPVYGSLTKSYPSLSDKKVKILLSHNPAHWVDSIADNSKTNIALTLSGHTHAMQITIAGWSPAAFRYKKWGGLYFDNDSTHQLYVNIGIGTVGLPMRMGATPEITLFTLKRKD